MTQEEFKSLSSAAQEEFINSGGTIEISLSESITGPVEKLLIPSSQDVVVSPLGTKQEGTSEFSHVDSEVKEVSVVSPSTDDSPPVSSPYCEGFDIKDPVELLILLDDDIASGKVTLHPWQIQYLIDFASEDFTDKNPFQSVVRACNGSGKDKYIIAPCVIWLCMHYKRARGIVTSSSGVQLDNQTCYYMTMLANAANRKWGKAAGNSCDVWKVNYRFYYCIPTESPIICYATDEPGKAEGFHPLESSRKMFIAVSEDKTVPDEINTALNRCSGYTHRAHVSTPGIPNGHFHDYSISSIPRATISKVSEVSAGEWIEYHVKWTDCPHIPASYFKQTVDNTPGGENSPVIKSQFFAEFGTTDELVVIPSINVWRAKKKPLAEWIQEPFNKAGLDLADGGNETVLHVRNGNRSIKQIPFKFDNGDDTFNFLVEQFHANDLNHPESYIFGDSCGIGKPTLDRLKRAGWSNIRYRDNRSKSFRPQTYKNWGAESWFNFAKLLSRFEIILLDDPQLIKQLCTRYYKIVDGAIHQLLSKIEMRARGYLSPDRADACILAYSDYKTTFKEYDEKEEKPFAPPKEELKDQIKSEFCFKSHCNGAYDKYKGQWTRNNGQKDFSEVEDALADYNRNKQLEKVKV